MLQEWSFMEFDISCLSTIAFQPIITIMHYFVDRAKIFAPFTIYDGI